MERFFSFSPSSNEPKINSLPNSMPLKTSHASPSLTRVSQKFFSFAVRFLEGGRASFDLVEPGLRLTAHRPSQAKPICAKPDDADETILDSAERKFPNSATIATLSCESAILL